jgi:TRAP transporter TAXI family solute receptor
MDELREKTRPLWAARSALVAVLLALAVAAPAVGIEPTLVSIGTGGKTGVYYIAGGAICGLVNDHRWQHGIRCLTESSGGSIDNLTDVRSGARTFGIVQSDWLYHAVQGTAVFADAGPDRELRSVFGMFPESFTVVARPAAGILAFRDLKGKRVSLGPSGSGGRATMRVVMQEMGWADTDFAYIADLAMPDVPRALCNGEVDAAVFIVAHPNLTVEDMVSSCGAVLVPVDGPEIDDLVVANVYYAPSEIRADTYPDQASGVPTFALTATLVTSSRTSPTVVYELTKAVFDNFDAFRAVHPAFEELDKMRMISGQTAPLHEGALRYLEQARSP